MGLDFNPYPVMMRVFEAMLAEKEVVDAHWKNQPDTPDDLRG